MLELVTPQMAPPSELTELRPVSDDVGPAARPLGVRNNPIPPDMDMDRREPPVPDIATPAAFSTDAP